MNTDIAQNDLDKIEAGIREKYSRTSRTPLKL